MSRPQLSLPNKAPNDGGGVVVTTSFSPLISTHSVEVTCVPPVSSLPATTLVAPQMLNIEGDGFAVEQRRLEVIAKGILGRFHPADKSWFFTYAKSLMRLTDESLNRSRETLAKIYRYQDLHDLMQVLSEPVHAGPYDDDISDDDWETDIVQTALTERNARTIEITRNQNPRLIYDPSTLCTSDLVYDLRLFSSPQTHRMAVRELGLPKRTSAERKLRRDVFNVEIFEPLKDSGLD